MLNKIVFLCANPWETVQLPIIRDPAKSYYEQISQQSFLCEEPLYCQQRIALYGESEYAKKDELFKSENKEIQIIYVQSHEDQTFQKILNVADLVIVGVPWSKKECDKILIQLLPWRDKLLFLWDRKIFEKSFLKQLKREYGLSAKQFLEAEKLPSYLTEAFVR